MPPGPGMLNTAQAPVATATPLMAAPPPPQAINEMVRTARLISGKDATEFELGFAPGVLSAATIRLRLIGPGRVAVKAITDRTGSFTEAELRQAVESITERGITVVDVELVYRS